MNNLKREHERKRSRAVGRGGRRGKTSGRGGKGQTARAGNKRRPELRDIIKRLPKNRGYKFGSFRKEVLIKRNDLLPEEKNSKVFSVVRKRLNIKGRKIRIK